MAEFNTQIKKRNAGNTGWDTIMPITLAGNVQMANGGNVDTEFDLRGINVKKNGAAGDGVTNDLTAVQATIDSVIADGSKFVYFPAGKYNVDTTALTNADKVTFVGNGASFINGKAYNILQYGDRQKGYSLYTRALEHMIVPKGGLLQAQNAIRTGTLKVAMWGDSITEGSDQANILDSYAERFRADLIAALPNTTIDFFNYAIAGLGLAQAVDADYEPDRSWATVAGQSWQDYVKNFAPDLLVVAFGMNDVGVVGSDQIEATNLALLQTFIATWTKKPSVVLVPTIIPTLDTVRSSQSQVESIAVARATREFAKEMKYATADAMRLFRILRDGKDDETRQGFNETFSTYNSTNWFGNVSDFTFAGNTITPTSGAIGKFVRRKRDFYNGNISVDINPSVEGANGIGWINYRIDDTFGKFTLIVTPSNSSAGTIEVYFNTTLLQTVSSLAIPTGSNSTILIVTNGINHKIYLNGVLKIDFSIYSGLHDGQIEFGSDHTVPTFANLSIDFLDPIQTEPPFTEYELLGPYGDSVASGNGINHPSGIGHSLFYQPAFFNIIKELTNTLVINSKKTVTLLNSWVTFSSPFVEAGYYKTNEGMVQLTGLIHAGTETADTVVFTLPAGDRPDGQILKYTVSSDGANYYPCALWIYSTGDVKIGTVQTGTWISLDGVAPFRAS